MVEEGTDPVGDLAPALGSVGSHELHLSRKDLKRLTDAMALAIRSSGSAPEAPASTDGSSTSAGMLG